MKLNSIYTKKAPDAIGPYSQAIEVDGFVYTSGQIPVNPETGELITGDIKKATHQSIKNVQAILEECGLTLNDVVKSMIFITNMDDFGAINEVYGEYFNEHKPARSCVQVAKLPKGAEIEIEVVAKK